MFSLLVDLDGPAICIDISVPVEDVSCALVLSEGQCNDLVGGGCRVNGDRGGGNFFK